MPSKECPQYQNGDSKNNVVYVKTITGLVSNVLKKTASIIFILNVEEEQGCNMSSNIYQSETTGIIAKNIPNFMLTKLFTIANM